VKVYGDVPPEAEPVSVTCWPTPGEDGLKVKLALKGAGRFVAVTDCWDVAVCCGDPLSFAVRTTVKDPADV